MDLVEFLTEKAKSDEMSVVNVKGGAAIELIDLEIDKVLRNIEDPNASGKKRKVIFELEFDPNEDRTVINIAINIKSVLAGPEPVKLAATISTVEGNRPVAKELDKQQNLFTGSVSPIQQGLKEI